MREEAPHFPAYWFESNKGYPCYRHEAALQAWGPTSIHRRRWAFMDRLVWWRTEPPPPVQGALL
jgi:ribonuclease HII